MKLIPGVANPFEFQYTNTDGVAINLTGFTLRLVFWFPQNEYELLSANRHGNILLAKDLYVEDSYAGKATTLLTDQETLSLARNGRSALRWSIYLLDQQSTNVFSAQITSAGEPWGMAHFVQSDLPNAELIRGISISRGDNPPTSFVSLGGVTAVSQNGALTIS